MNVLRALVLAMICLIMSAPVSAAGNGHNSCEQVSMYAYAVTQAKLNGMTLEKYKSNVQALIKLDPVMKDTPGLYKAMADYAETVWEMNGTPEQVYEIVLYDCQHGDDSI